MKRLIVYQFVLASVLLLTNMIAPYKKYIEREPRVRGVSLLAITHHHTSATTLTAVCTWEKALWPNEGKGAELVSVFSIMDLLVPSSSLHRSSVIHSLHHPTHSLSLSLSLSLSHDIYIYIYINCLHSVSLRLFDSIITTWILKCSIFPHLLNLKLNTELERVKSSGPFFGMWIKGEGRTSAEFWLCFY